MMRADMENVMSGARAANVNFQSWGKFSALNIHCFVLNRLLVVIFFIFFFKSKYCRFSESLLENLWY